SPRALARRQRPRANRDRAGRERVWEDLEAAGGVIMVDKLPARLFCSALLSLCGVLLLALALGGCVTKKAADAQARKAYLAGQQEARMQMQQYQTQGQGPCVTVNGEVHNHVVPWIQGLTLAKALLAADYYGTTDPGQI